MGFLLNKNVGYSRNFDFEEASLSLGEDLYLFDFHGALRLTRTGQGVYAQGKLHGSFEQECVRCLTTFPQELDAKLDELFIYPPDKASDPQLASGAGLAIEDAIVISLGPVHCYPADVSALDATCLRMRTGFAMPSLPPISPCLTRRPRTPPFRGWAPPYRRCC